MEENWAIKYLEEAVAQIMAQEYISKYHLETEGTSKVGDGFMGDILFFQIKTDSRDYKLVLKLASRDDNFRTQMLLDKAFDREILMYTKIFPTLKSVFPSSIPQLDFLPKLYWCSNEHKKEAIILENMKADGFQMWPKEQCLKIDDIQLILGHLATFHGLVMAFKDQNPEVFKEWIPNFYDMRLQLYTQLGLIKHAEKHIKLVLRILNERKLKNIVKKYEHLTKNLEQYYQPPLNENDRIVITHGDCWINNIMFRKQDDTNDIKLIDFQISSLSTPIEDLGLFLYSACDATTLESFDALNKHYYLTLENTIRKCGSDPQKIFPFETLQEHWRKYGIFGVLSAIELHKLQLVTEDETPDLKACEDGLYDVKMKHHDLYIERLVNIFIHYGNKFF